MSANHLVSWNVAVVALVLIALLVASRSVLTAQLSASQGIVYGDEVANVVIRPVQTLNKDEKAAIVASLLEMKLMPSAYDSSINAYDYFVRLHLAAVLPSTHIHSGEHSDRCHSNRGCRLRLKIYFVIFSKLPTMF
jgi:hypothetical protein